jgi:hypothetical protein
MLMLGVQLFLPSKAPLLLWRFVPVAGVRGVCDDDVVQGSLLLSSELDLANNIVFATTSSCYVRCKCYIAPHEVSTWRIVT